MFTRHGHHIPGTIKDSTRPKFTKRCGGVNHCAQCTGEWEKWFEMNTEKKNIIGTVALTDKSGEKVIGSGQLEKLPGGTIVVHADIVDDQLSALMNGFSIGSFSISTEE